MTAPPELHAFLALLPDDFAMVEAHETLDGRRKGRCVEATRLAVAVLQAVGLDARPLACDVMAANARAVPLLLDHVPVRSWSPGAWSTGSKCDDPPAQANLQEPTRRRGFAGHLLVAGDTWFCDLTAEQFHRPSKRIVVPGPVVGPYQPGEYGTVMQLENGANLTWVWRPEVKAYRTVPAWRQDVPRDLLNLVVQRVRDAMARAPEATG